MHVEAPAVHHRLLRRAARALGAIVPPDNAAVSRRHVEGELTALGEIDAVLRHVVEESIHCIGDRMPDLMPGLLFEAPWAGEEATLTCDRVAYSAPAPDFSSVCSVERAHHRYRRNHAGPRARYIDAAVVIGEDRVTTDVRQRDGAPDRPASRSVECVQPRTNVACGLDDYEHPSGGDQRIGDGPAQVDRPFVSEGRSET